MPFTFVIPPSLGSAKSAARAELIEGALARELGERANIVIATSYGDLEARVISGRADLAWAPTMVCTKLPAVRGLFTLVRNGTTHYRSMLVARKEDALSLGRLHGKHVAWVDPLSAGGDPLAVALLRARGIDIDTTFATQSFTGSHRASIEAVLHGTADIAAVSAREPNEQSVEAALQWYAGPTAHHLTALTVSEPCLNDALVISRGVSASDGARLMTQLVPSTASAIARSRLLAALEADRFVEATLDDYHRLAPLFAGEVGVPARLSLPPSRRTERPR